MAALWSGLNGAIDTLTELTLTELTLTGPFGSA